MRACVQSCQFATWLVYRCCECDLTSCDSYSIGMLELCTADLEIAIQCITRGRLCRADWYKYN